jgi:hypothetical protein
MTRSALFFSIFVCLLAGSASIWGASLSAEKAIPDDVLEDLFENSRMSETVRIHGRISRLTKGAFFTSREAVESEIAKEAIRLRKASSRIERDEDATSLAWATAMQKYADNYFAFTFTGVRRGKRYVETYTESDVYQINPFTSEKIANPQPDTVVQAKGDHLYLEYWSKWPTRPGGALVPPTAFLGDRDIAAYGDIWHVGTLPGIREETMTFPTFADAIRRQYGLISRSANSVTIGNSSVEIVLDPTHGCLAREIRIHASNEGTKDYIRKETICSDFRLVSGQWTPMRCVEETRSLNPITRQVEITMRQTIEISNIEVNGAIPDNEIDFAVPAGTGVQPAPDTHLGILSSKSPTTLKEATRLTALEKRFLSPLPDDASAKIDADFLKLANTERVLEKREVSVTDSSGDKPTSHSTVAASVSPPVAKGAENRPHPMKQYVLWVSALLAGLVFVLVIALLVSRRRRDL